MFFFDTETTGINPKKDKVIEFAYLLVDKGEVIEEYDKLIKINGFLPSKIISITGITDKLLYEKGVSEESVAKDLMNVLNKGTLMIAHNLQFDMNFLYQLLCKYFESKKIDELFKSMFWLDTLTVFKDRKGYPNKLSDLVSHYELGNFKFHRAIDDTKVLPLALKSMTKERNDIKRYLNVFGYNKKYGVNGKQFDFITYVPQGYTKKMVKPSDILPSQKMLKKAD